MRIRPGRRSKRSATLSFPVAAARQGCSKRRLVSSVLDALAAVLETRRHADPATSYVASLHARGLDAILRKVGEENTELLLAAKDGARDDIVHESADLLFHVLVLLSHLGLHHDLILRELERRMGTSGLIEKAQREPGTVRVADSATPVTGTGPCRDTGDSPGEGELG